MKRPLKITRPRLISILSVGILAIIAIVTIFLANMSRSLSQQRVSSQFAAGTQETSDRIRANLNSYATTLYASRSFLLNSQEVTQGEWNGFFRNQDVFNRYKGISSISYIQIVPNDQKDQFVAQHRKMADFGADFTINPPGSRPTYGIATLLVSAANIRPTGFDVLSTADRQATYQAATVSGQPTVSAQTLFPSGIKGFYMLLSVTRQGNTVGYVNVATHTEDFFPELVNPSQLGVVSLRITDITESSNQMQLYQSPNWQQNKSNITRADTIKFGGRVWRVDYESPANYLQGSIPSTIPYLVLATGLMLSCILAACFYFLHRASSTRTTRTTRTTEVTKTITLDE